MSWKAVEMQIAIPRTLDAGKMQDQLQQQGRIDQNQLAQSIAKEEWRKRTQILKQQASEQLKNNKKQSNSNVMAECGQKPKEKKLQHYPRHPYLGIKVDFNG